MSCYLQDKTAKFFYLFSSTFFAPKIGQYYTYRFELLTHNSCINFGVLEVRQVEKKHCLSLLKWKNRMLRQLVSFSKTIFHKMESEEMCLENVFKRLKENDYLRRKRKMHSFLKQMLYFHNSISCKPQHIYQRNSFSIKTQIYNVSSIVITKTISIGS